MQLYELLYPLFAHTNSSCQQLLSSAWLAVAASRFGVDGLEVHQKCVAADIATLGSAGQTNEVLVVPGYA